MLTELDNIFQAILQSKSEEKYYYKIFIHLLENQYRAHLLFIENGGSKSDLQFRLGLCEHITEK